MQGQHKREPRPANLEGKQDLKSTAKMLRHQEETDLKPLKSCLDLSRRQQKSVTVFLSQRGMSSSAPTPVMAAAENKTQKKSIQNSLSTELCNLAQVAEADFMNHS